MPKDDNTPATKKDLRELEKRVETSLQQSEKRIMHHFNVVAENLVHDFQGAHSDKIGIHEDKLADHEGRLIRLEKRAGIFTA
jgi:hypothetical protein